MTDTKTSYLTLVDGFGEALQIESGFFYLFEDAAEGREFIARAGKARRRDEIKADFMERYRLLLCDLVPPVSLERYATLKHEIVINANPLEFDAVKGLLDTCKRLALIGYGKAPESDIWSVKGFEAAEGGGFLHIDLTKSYWYKRFLHTATRAFKPGEGMKGPIVNLHLIDLDYYGNTPYKPDWKAQIEKRHPNYPEIENARRDSGSFGYPPIEGDYWIAHDEYFGKRFEADREDRRTFMAFKDRDFESDNLNGLAQFWTDNHLIVKGWGDNPEDIARHIANTLLQTHTRGIMHEFDYLRGYTLTAPSGIQALWADFALCLATAEIKFCEECRAPIVTDRKARSTPRQFCSQACQKRHKRREQREAEAAREATEQQ